MPDVRHASRLAEVSTPKDAAAACLVALSTGVPGRAARTAITVGIAVLVATSLIPVIDGSAPDWARVVDPVVAVAAVVLVPVVFRRPVEAAVALAVLVSVSPAATPASTAALFVVALRYRMRRGVPVALLGIAAHAAQGAIRPNESIGYGWWLVLFVAVHAALLGAAVAFGTHIALVNSLRERAERAEAEQALRVAEARHAERERIAREMHDVLAHRLSLLATYAGALEYRPDSSPRQLATAAGVVRDGIHRALGELRDVVGVLRHGDGADPDVDRAPQAGLADLDDLVAETRAAGNPVDVESYLDPEATPPLSLDRTAYRVAQEGLTNARKHAPGAPISMRIAGRPGDTLTLELVNQVCSEPASAVAALGAGTGLVGLAERAAMVDGRFSHDVTPDGRFRLRLEAPWPA